VFNLLGPLSNPAAATRQVMGVYDGALTSLAAHTLHALGSERALVVHGEIGLDEISTVGPTKVCELKEGVVEEYLLTTRELGLEGPEPDPDWLAPAGTPEENADILRAVLSGHAGDAQLTARRDLVAVNAAASLRVAGLAESWAESVRMAQQILASGEALRRLERLAAFTQTV
jgi:anthranilate phosphoribosyltransferase